MGCINALKEALGSCSIKQRLRWLEKMNAAVPDAWPALKADVSLFQADDIVKEALLGALWTASSTSCESGVPLHVIYDAVVLQLCLVSVRKTGCWVLCVGQPPREGTLQIVGDQAPQYHFPRSSESY